MSFFDKLDEKKILVSDGAWGTEIAKLGYSGGCPELLNVEHPDIIGGIARSYVEAGSDIILTNTFGGNPYKLGKYGVADRLEELNEAGVRISRKAAGDRALVFASLGPSGEFLEPLGAVTAEEMTAGFARQIKAMLHGGADGIAIESMTDIGEAVCAVNAAKQVSHLPVVCTMTFDKGLHGFATIMGVRPDDAVRALGEAGVDLAGSNCGWGIDDIIEVARIMRPATKLPLWFKPNAGMPELVDGVTVYRQTPEYMASRAGELLEIGTSVIGGCCGSTPDHIRKIREVVDKRTGK
jgi:5-methyltetrahydrofolate--homocysteine methyltransferase